MAENLSLLGCEHDQPNKQREREWRAIVIFSICSDWQTSTISSKQVANFSLN
jgi:hypothetical protein